MDGQERLTATGKQPVSGEGSVKLPTRSRTLRAERVASLMAGSLAKLLWASILSNILLVLAIYYLVTRPAEVFMVEETKGKFYKVRGPVQDADVLQILMEKFARHYVTTRETVDLVSERERFEWVKDNSTNAVYEKFLQALSKDNVIKAATDSDTVWKIDIANVWQSNDANSGIWTVEILKTYFRRGKLLSADEPWIIDLEVDRDSRVKTPQQQLENPASLYVKSYRIREKEAVVKGMEH